MPLLSATSMTFPVSTRRPVGLEVYQNGSIMWYDAGPKVGGRPLPASSGQGWTVRDRPAGSRLAVAVPVAGAAEVVRRAERVGLCARQGPVHVVPVGAQGDPQIDGDARQVGGGGDAQGVAGTGAAGDLPDDVPVGADPEAERRGRGGQHGPARPHGGDGQPVRGDAQFVGGCRDGDRPPGVGGGRCRADQRGGQHQRRRAAADSSSQP